MSGKHFNKYLQKYRLFISFAIISVFLYACSTTKKVPDGEFLLTKNKFKYEDGKIFDDELPNYVSQKPNKKQLFLLPVGLWMYNFANPKYDSILNEYMTYPGEMRNQNLRDSLFIKYEHPEYVGKGLFWDRFFHTVGKAPVILEQGRTETSANSIRKRLVYRGYWDSEVKFNHDLDSAAKKAQVTYLITHKDPTYIQDYYYNIPDPNIKRIYEEDLRKSLVKSKEILDQTNLEKEIKRLSDLMKERGYYRFNNAGDEIFYTADTLTSRKQVPLIMDIHKDSADTPYKVATIGNIDVAIVENASDFPKNTEKDSLRGIRFHKIDNQFKTRAMWRALTITPKDVFNQKDLDLTKRNILAMNNFSILKSRDSLRRDGLGSPNDSIVDVLYLLKPLPKFELKLATDINYSQILNFGISPSADLTTRNVFGGAENLSTSVSGIFGSVRDPKNTDKRLFAYEISAQANLSFPRLLLPFTYYKLIPKRYSPTSSISLGVSKQNNVGMDRMNFNTGLNYFANVNDIVSHKLTLFNTQLSLTKNKDRYFEFFPAEGEIKDRMFKLYFENNPAVAAQYNSQQISSDQVSGLILNDVGFQTALNTVEMNDFNAFSQSVINKNRQTQDVLISSIVYNFIYNEIGKKNYQNPFYFSGKIESAGNIFSLFNSKNRQENLLSEQQKTIFNIPYSQFVKFDFDVRKYYTFANGKHTLALRQFIGLGIPYGNSSQMPFVRSYFNGGSNDIRAWTAFGGLGPADSQLDERVRSYVMDNVKLTTNIEYRIPFTDMYEGAVFTDMGNIWSLKDSGFGDQFKFNKFLSQMGVGSGFGLRINVAYITLRLDLAYKIYDPNKPDGERWRFSKIQPLKPTLNFAFGYPF
ncbi:BamA/TamA family outer membrane protein [Chryseobacterium sp.]|uniref:translocation and assembly module lipoprotein TamL n=1 Tax=Chryseobacterium sp. TaxID=1871047 RepID=UPI0011CAFBB0|nr:BamA/TamA family outer membrane protein [Chryseobacterium sp.]TXF79524.1 BamA/TamA family outer membrane protein [Chryseobacterium sp.]